MAETIATAIAIASLMTPVAEGKATRFGPGVMDMVVANRVKWGQLDLSKPYKGFVALAHKQHIGKRVMIAAKGELWGPFLVADCGAAHDLAHLKEIGFAVDLSYEVAQEMLDDIDAPLWGVKVYVVDD